MSEYKNWQPRSSAPTASKIAFSQNGKGDSNDWHKDATCHECGKKGHICPNCPNFNKTVTDDDDDDAADKKAAKKKSYKKKKAKKDKKQVAFSQQEADDDESAIESSDNESDSDFSFCNTTNMLKANLRSMILLDNQSTTDLFCNRRLVSKVWTCKESMTIEGNGGTLTTNQKALIKNYGKVWFHKDAITNILSLKRVTEKYRVTYDSKSVSDFVVHKANGKELRFTMHLNGLHYHNT
jgi:hypothetical protein